MKQKFSIRRFLRPRFSLGAMLILITLIAIPLAYVSQRRIWNAKRRAAYDRLIAKDFAIISFAVSTNRFLISDPIDPFSSAEEEEEEGHWTLAGAWNDLCLNSEASHLFIFESGSRGLNWSSVNENDLADLALFPELEVIRLNLAAKVTDEQLAPLKAFPHLRELSISGSQAVTGECFRYLEHLDHLEALELFSLPELQGNHLPDLKGLPHFKSLILRECPQLSDVSLRHVNLPSTVTHLEIEGKLLGDETICRWLSQVRPWELVLKASATRKIAGGLARQDLLDRLEIFDAPLVDEDFDFLSKCLQLTALKLEVMPVRGDFLNTLPSPSLLAELSLDSTLLNDHNLATIARFQNLSTVKLDWTPIHGEGFEGVVEWPQAVSFSLMGTQFNEQGKRALAKIQGPRLVILPANWSPCDIDLFASNEPPFETIPGIGKTQVVGGAYPWNGPLWNKPPRNVSPEQLAPVLRLYELERERVRREANDVQPSLGSEQR